MFLSVRMSTKPILMDFTIIVALAIIRTTTVVGSLVATQPALAKISSWEENNQYQEEETVVATSQRADINDNNTKTEASTQQESIPSVPTLSPPSSSPSIQKQEEENKDVEKEESEPEPEPEPEDNDDTTIFWDIEDAQNSGQDNEQPFDLEGNMFDLEWVLMWK